MVSGDLSETDRDLLCDPQTSGGLLVSCAPDVAEDVLALFARHGHDGAAIIGRVESGTPSVQVI
jgi:selenide,water dikinase